MIKKEKEQYSSSRKTSTGAVKKTSDKTLVKKTSDKTPVRKTSAKASSGTTKSMPGSSAGTSGKRSSAKKTAKRKKKSGSSPIFKIAAVIIVIAVLGFLGMKVTKLNTGSAHDEKGLEAYKSGNYAEAVREFQEAVSYDEQSADYYIHLGMALIEERSCDEALGYFLSAWELAKDDEEKYLTLRGRGLAYLCQGKYTEADKTFEQVLGYESLPDDLRTDVLFYQAEACESLSDYEGAAESYSGVLKISAGNAQALMKRGLAYEELGNYASAESDLREAIHKSKTSYAIYRALYEALTKQGKKEEANQVLDEALKMEWKTGEDCFYRGEIYIARGDLENARTMFERSYELGYVPALLGKGEVADLGKDRAGACAHYERFFSEIGENAEPELMAAAYDRYSAVLLQIGRYEDAIAACQAGLSCNSRSMDASLTFNLIVAYEDLNQWENAYSAAKTYHDKYPDDEKGTKEFYFLESRIAR